MADQKRMSFRKVLETGLTGLTILSGTALLLYAIAQLIAFSAFGGFDPNYSVSELKANFEKNETAIYELKQYFNQIVPRNKLVEIEFDGDCTLSRLGLGTLSLATGKPNQDLRLYSNLGIDSKAADSVLENLGWTDETLRDLKAKLDAAGCIGVVSGEPTKINFHRSGLGMYSFDVFNEHIPDSQQRCYNDSCTYIMVNDKLVLEYGGGVAGEQCFYKLN
ncbi:MAG: hypothetical protein EOP52_06330 [Sphingobacteriales bacterium]|nr:MAG: hypothetical protein EOP52_06330 [Sphingobacteriales bacterium]